MIAIPFLGSKRNYVKPIEKLVLENGYTTVYEPFGGSAVLSVNLYNDGIINRAVINDYDHLFDLYPEYLDIKDELIKKLEDQGFTKSKKKRLSEQKRNYLQDLVSKIDQKYWSLLANNFVFSARSTDLRLKDFCYFVNDLTTIKQRQYLDIVSNLERTSLDYADFLRRYFLQYDEHSLIILDPPYLNSAQKQYSNEKFFGLADTINLLQEIKQTGADFIFFNMVERDTVALIEALGFEIEETRVKRITLNKTAKREDVMVYCRQMKRAEIDALQKVA